MAVTIYIGEVLTRQRVEHSRRTVLLAEDTLLNSDDCRKLQDVAFKALDQLYSIRLRHKDLAERNVRSDGRWTKGKCEVTSVISLVHWSWTCVRFRRQGRCNGR